MKNAFVAAVATAALLSLGLAGCSGSSDTPKPTSKTNKVSTSTTPAKAVQNTETGKVLPIKVTIPVAGSAESVKTPDGGWRISPASFGPQVSYGGINYKAPTGSMIVPISWLYTPPAPSTSGEGAVSPVPSAPATKLSLVAGKKVYPLTTNPTTSGSVLVTIPAADVPAMKIAMSFDKVTQKVNSAGQRVLNVGIASDGLYDGLSNTGTGVCPSVSSQFTGLGGRFTGSCGLNSITRSAWLPGIGWAGNHQVWVQVTGIINPGAMTWTDKSGKKTITTKYDVKGSLTGATLSGNAATDVKQTGASYTLRFKATAGVGSMPLKINEVLTGKATTPIKAPMTAPTTQQVQVDIVSPLTFQKSTN